MNDLVSIITPCYNGEKYLDRFFSSILNQTYKNIELIFINDGSNDNTENVALAYKKQIEGAGMRFIYIYQDNQGQAVAVNKGLKIFTGKYLTWPDADDFLLPDSIEKRVDFLERHNEYGFVRSDAYIFYDNNLTEPIKKLNRNSPRRFDEYLFDRFLLELNMYSMPGVFLVRAKAIENAIPDKDIFCSRGGQNWQIQLPIAYMYKCGYIDEPLFGYVIRENSHSRSIDKTNLIKVFERYDILKEIIEETIKRIPLNQLKYKKLIDEKYNRLKLIAALNAQDFEMSKKYFSLLKDSSSLRFSDRIRFVFRDKPIVFRLIADINKILFYFGIYGF